MLLSIFDNGSATDDARPAALGAGGSVASPVMVVARSALWYGVSLPQGTTDFQRTVRACALGCCGAATALSMLLLLPTLRVRGRTLWARCPSYLWRWTIFAILVLLRAANGLSTTSAFPPPFAFPRVAVELASPPVKFAVGGAGWG